MMDSFSSKKRLPYISLALMVISCIIYYAQQPSQKYSLLKVRQKQSRSLEVQVDPRTIIMKEKVVAEDTSSITTTDSGDLTTMTSSFNLPPKLVEDWCSAPKSFPLPYRDCKNKDIVNSIPLYGGLTNTLKMLLLGAILSFEEDRCFVIDESTSALPKRVDPANLFNTTFLERYFEPIGLSPSDDIVKEAKEVQARDWKESWDWKHNRRVFRQRDTIHSLGLINAHGHDLKRHVLKRMWRPLPQVRDRTCSKLEQLFNGSIQDYIAFSVRRGDKFELEHFEFATANQYITAAEKAIVNQFNGHVPIIFVATDDCSIMDEFHTLRPNWTFVSECSSDQKQIDGFRLTDMSQWTHDDTDTHFHKFFVELFAMAAAKYFIGVIYTNVTWWVLFMRSSSEGNNDKKDFEILKTPGTENREGIDYWR